MFILNKVFALNRLQNDIIGLIPAAGRGTRISPLPLSKELFPIGFQGSPESPRPKVVSQYLLEQMHRANIKQCFIILGEGKWDIPAFYGNGDKIGIDLAYSVIRNSQGTPFTLDTVYSFISHNIIALGFPDILFDTPNIYCQMIEAFSNKQCDVLLGLFPADSPHLSDMISFDMQGTVDRISIKPLKTDLTHTWGVALWSPKFTQFMHDWLRSIDISNPHLYGAKHGHGELFVGDVVQAAIEDGLHVSAIKVSEKPYLDIGTPQNLMRAVVDHTRFQTKR